MTTQRVFRLPQRTSILDLQVNEERGIALNFRDFAVTTGKYPFPVKDNVVPRSDLSGEVVRVGNQVDDFAEGDRVIASFDLKTLYSAMPGWHHSLGGCYDGVLREYIALPSSALVKVSPTSGLSFAQLSALVCTSTTAWNALYGNNPLEPGQTVLFLGTGGVSINGLILAKVAVLKTYGADYTINYKSNANWSQEVLKITNGHGADFILENGGAGTIAQSIVTVAYGGNITVIGFLAPCPQEKMPDVAALALSKGAIVCGIMVGSKQQLEDVTRFVTFENLNVPVEKVFGFEREDVVSAFEYLVSGQHIGKVCIVVN
ncbi:hypothetical protein GT037_005732 [Alternaria burnsii]|uniref:Enoyl reductase (ER) domain-containing protein n=1 Tax=Alternaria burnsii TaxID=1187904 RepID=A0A8H7B4I8_9PLEO|nr:uncharacterized protein GT037_005732 [Alternaria burnsii]KAF7676227.1 hypothetical protein GT037_005732 [Alternaria burnsii]